MKYFNYAVRLVSFPFVFCCWVLFAIGCALEDLGDGLQRVAEWCRDKYVPFFNKHFPID